MHLFPSKWQQMIIFNKKVINRALVIFNFEPIDKPVYIRITFLKKNYGFDKSNKICLMFNV